MESSSFSNGDSETSFLSLLMADDPITQTQTQDGLLLKDELPPFPPSSFDATPAAHFLSPDYTLLLPTPSDYSPSFNPAGFHGEYGLKSLKVEQQQPSLSSSSPPALMNQMFRASTLPELLSLETLSQTPPIVVSKEDSYLGMQQLKKRKKNSNQRQRMSEKMYSLGRLLPGSHRGRLSAVEMLEEAHKYISFLKAQVGALRLMPTESRIAVAGKGSPQEGLGRLTRQQLLQVVVNSPAAQSVMAEKGWCVVSTEQVVTLKKIEARKKLIQQLLNHLPL